MKKTDNIKQLFFSSIVIIFFTCFPVISQALDNPKPKDSIRNKDVLINATLFSATTISYTGLHQLWYKNYYRSKFEFFNDLHEWNYMDKTGHIFSAYHLNNFCYTLLNNQKIKNPLLKSSIYSFTYMTGIEFFDGYSKQWGFSIYDLIANSIGTFLFAFQQEKLKTPIFNLKFSSHMSPMASCRPSLLGKNKVERVFKDYNGQTYWLTVNLNKTFKDKIKAFKFIDIAIGYSIDGFTGARENPTSNCSECNNLQQKSVLTFSLDFNANSLKGKNKLLDVFIKTFSIIKIPAPTFIFNQKPSFKLFYF